MRSTIFFDSDRGYVGEDFYLELQKELQGGGVDLLIICDTIDAYGDDTENPRSGSFAQFLQKYLKASPSSAKPCAILALVKLDDADPMISRFLEKCGEGTFDRNLEQKLLGSTRGRAVSEWARRIFVLGRIALGSALQPIVLGCLRYDRKLTPWSSFRFGREALGHALRFCGGLFREIRLEEIKRDIERELIAESFSCADTIGKDINQ